MQRAAQNRDFARGTAAARGFGLLPVLQYRDLSAAIAWLTKAFGFAEHEIVHAEGGTPLFALLSFGSALIMIGPVRNDESGSPIKPPDATGGAETQSCYLVVEDVDAHYAAAKAAGATIVSDLKPYDFGGRGYSCRDLEGHIWNFGNYDPWLKPTAPGGRRTTFAWMPALVAVLAAFAVAGWLTAASYMRSSQAPLSQLPAVGVDLAATAALQTERSARQRAESALQAASRQAAAEREARLTLEKRLANGSKQAPDERKAQQEAEHATAALKRERSARQGAESAFKAASKLAEAEREARINLEKVLADISKQAAAERKALQEAQRAALAAREEGARQSGAVVATERQLQQARQQLEREQRTLVTLRAQLQATERAKEKAERTAQEARKRLAEIEAARAAVTPPRAVPLPPRREAPPTAKQAVKPKPQRKATRETAEPMPALIP